MEITKEKLNLEDGLSKEWLITNGIGGFCSSTIIGANTRKYHGLLIAPLTPPARRYLILSKISEDKLFYLMSKGIDSEKAKELIIMGFIGAFREELPMEYAVILKM